MSASLSFMQSDSKSCIYNYLSSLSIIISKIREFPILLNNYKK